MKIWQGIIAIALIGAVGFGLFRLSYEKKDLEKEVAELEKKESGLAEETKNLQARLEHLKISENLIKEVKARFNYRAPGEKLIILVSPAPSFAPVQE